MKTEPLTPNQAIEILKRMYNEQGIPILNDIIETITLLDNQLVAERKYGNEVHAIICDFDPDFQHLSVLESVAGLINRWKNVGA